MNWKIQFFSVIGLTAIGLGQLLGQPPANERYYMIVFAAQDEGNVVRKSHTFATFVKAEGDRFESHTLSWMPRMLTPRIFWRKPEPGVNLGLAESLQLAKSVGAGVTMWGPYRVNKELFDMAVAQEARLNSGAILYVVLDDEFRGTASNCIHAVSNLDTTQRGLETGLMFGNDASEVVVKHFKPYIIPSDDSMQWLLDRLNLNSREIATAQLPGIDNSSMKVKR